MDSAVRSDGRVPDGFFLSRRFLLADGNTLTQSCQFAATDRSPFKFLTVLTKPPGNKKPTGKSCGLVLVTQISVHSIFASSLFFSCHEVVPLSPSRASPPVTPTMHGSPPAPPSDLPRALSAMGGSAPCVSSTPTASSIPAMSSTGYELCAMGNRTCPREAALLLFSSSPLRRDYLLLHS